MGGTSHDADILEAVLGQSIAPDLDLIRNSMAPPQVADKLAKMIWS